jgi:hypothetical protein
VQRALPSARPIFFQRSRYPLFQSQIITSAITSRLNNGGGIYTLNPQPGSKIHNNWFDDAAGSPSGGAIYPDQASASIDIYNNVCSNTKIYCLFINTVDTVTVHDNWSSNFNQVFLRPGTYSTVSNTVAISGALSNWPSGAQAVANNAGTESAYSNIKSMTDVCFQSSSCTVSPDRTCVPTAASITDTTGAVWTLRTGSPYPMILRNGVQAGGGYGSRITAFSIIVIT